VILGLFPNDSKYMLDKEMENCLEGGINIGAATKLVGRRPSVLDLEGILGNV
jgi:hypothetical protein